MNLRALLGLLLVPALALAGTGEQETEIGEFEDFEELYLGKLLASSWTSSTPPRVTNKRSE